MLNVINEVKRLKLPFGKYSVVGGAALASRGIRGYNDIDLIVTDELYDELKKIDWEERNINNDFFHIYKDNTEAAKSFSHIDGCNLDAESVIKNSDIIDGIPFMSLEDLIELKSVMGREKDLRDIESINEYLSK